MGNVPIWAKEPYNDAIDFIENIKRLVDVSVRGISLLPHVPGVVRVLSDDSPEDEETKEKIQYAEEMGTLAQREMETGFPLLLSHATISLWTALETLTKEYVITFLANDPSIMGAEAIRKIKISIGDYISMDEAERCHYVYEMLEKELAAPLKQGISRFESLLSVVGLGGTVKENVRRDLFELGHVRNVLIHRRSVADRRLVEACPWMSLSIGDSVVVNQRDLDRYMQACMRYCLEVLCRVGEHFGKSIREEVGVILARRREVPSPDPEAVPLPG